MIENTTYAPFGQILEGGQSSRYNYEGKEYDLLTDQTDFEFRMFDQDTGRFNQPDNQIQDIYYPQNLNRYSFESNNPLKYTDPTGMNYIALYDDQGAHGFGHSAGIVYNKDGAVFYSHQPTGDMSKFQSYTEAAELSFGATKQYEGVYVEADSLYELFGEIGDIIGEYGHSFEIETDDEQDERMKEKTDELNENKNYNLYNNNCATRQSDILRAGSVPHIRSTQPQDFFSGTKSLHSGKISGKYKKILISTNIESNTLNKNGRTYVQYTIKKTYKMVRE